MGAFKGILKYSIYLFIAGWMFVLGIMVGRGTSPVEFDTTKFQKRLETIAKEYGKKEDTPEKIDLKFYEVLDSPVPEASNDPRKASQEIVPKKGAPEEIPVKTSRKKLTFQKTGNPAALKESAKADSKAETKTAKTTAQKTAPVPAAKAKPPEPAPAAVAESGKYTVQVAAYKDFKDAVTQMTILEKKGFPSYRVKGEKDGVTWYRVRTGAFASMDEARKYRDRLKAAKIDAMIIKKE